ncbi:MAG TPA: hypothetical protein VFQ88_02425 [Nevskiaceae bacterium]|nr:hypothetical protein [Nevskiaceae bacterium]
MRASHPLALVLFVVIASTVSGCAIGHKQDFSNLPAALTYTGNDTLAVAVDDRRPYVLDDDKPASFVGLQRGTYGVPFNVLTQSGAPLAVDMSRSLAATFDAAGFSAEIVPTVIGEDAGDARARLLVARPHRGVLLTLDQWETDTYKRGTLKYALTLAVYDTTGKTLAAERTQGREELGGSLINPAGHARTAVEAAFKRMLSALLDTPAVAKALAR